MKCRTYLSPDKIPAHGTANTWLYVRIFFFNYCRKDALSFTILIFNGQILIHNEHMFTKALMYFIQLWQLVCHVLGMLPHFCSGALKAICLLYHAAGVSSSFIMEVNPLDGSGDFAMMKG